MSSSCSSIIHLRNLCKTYQSGKVSVEALRGVSLEVPQGEFLAIVGPSGSGKSTLFHIVGGLTPPTSGEVIVAGQDLSKVGDAGRTRLRAKHVSFVFQKFNLLPNLTALDNIRTALHIAGLPAQKFDSEFENVLELLGVRGRLHHKPSEMSGGEQQRVAIARALASEPRLILADEPTGNLASLQSEEIMQIFQELNAEGSTIVMVTHEPDIGQHCKRLVHIKDGVVLDDEPVENRLFAKDVLVEMAIERERELVAKAARNASAGRLQEVGGLTK